MEHVLYDRTDDTKTAPAYTGKSAISADWTDRPLPVDLAERLRARLIGQDEAVTAVVEAIELRALGLALGHPRPLAFLFCGPTGVGKTELATAIARELFPRRERLLRLDCSEFTEAHQVSRLVGAPPGYIGYGTRSLLDEFLSGGRGGVLLLDEFEKAHEVFHRLFLQVLDAGRLGDSGGRTLDLSGLVVIATTNAGQREARAIGFHRAKVLNQHETAIASFKNVFPIELLNRFDAVVRFKHLSRETARRILREHLAPEATRMLESRYEVAMEVSEAAVGFVMEAGYSRELGARNLQRAFSRLVLRPVAQMIRHSQVKGCLLIDTAAGSLVVSERRPH